MTRYQWTRFINRLFLLLLLPVLGFAAVKGFYWYQVRSAVEQLSKEISLVAKLEYGAIETGFDGVAGVRNLRLTPLGQKQGLSIDAVRVKAPGWLDLLMLRSTLEKGQLPQALGFEVRGVKIEMEDGFLQQLASQASAVDEPAAGGMLGCDAAVAGLAGPQLMSKLGYQQLELDLAADYSFDAAGKLLKLSLEQSVLDQFDLDMSIAFDLGINEFNRYNLAFISPSLGDLSLRYQDRSFNQRYLGLCAQAAGESPSEFVDRHLMLITALGLEWGVQLSEPLLEAYREFLLGSGEIRLSVLAGSQLWPTSLLQYPPEKIVQVLAPELSVNGQPVDLSKLSWRPPEAAVEPLQAKLRTHVEAFTELLQAPFVEPPPVIAVVETVLVPSVPQSAGRGYQTTALDQLSPYIGTDVRIETNNGNLIIGRLLSIERNELRIYQEVGFGNAILPIAFKHVAAVQVYR